MNSIRKSIASVGIAGALLMGGASLTMAQTSTTTAPTTASTTPSTVRPDRSARITSTLAPLVTAGTITQVQSDAVVKALVAADVGSGRGPGGFGGGGGGMHSATVATALGMTAADVETAVRSGTTIAQLATQKGVALQSVINALVAEETTEHPSQSAADILTHVTNMVNGVRPAQAF